MWFLIENYQQKLRSRFHIVLNPFIWEFSSFSTFYIVWKLKEKPTLNFIQSETNIGVYSSSNYTVPWNFLMTRLLQLWENFQIFFPHLEQVLDFNCWNGNVLVFSSVSISIHVSKILYTQFAIIKCLTSILQPTRKKTCSTKLHHKHQDSSAACEKKIKPCTARQLVIRKANRWFLKARFLQMRSHPKSIREPLHQPSTQEHHAIRKFTIRAQKC